MSDTKENEKFLIIDGNALIHRAFHAIPPTLYTKDNQLVNAVFGFTMMMLNALQKFNFTYVVCTFDMPGGVFRNDLYEGYKQNRKKMDDDLANQIEKIREVVSAFNIPIFEKPGYEADDLIGSLVEQIRASSKREQKNIDIIILSGDRDILQLINDTTSVVLPGRTFSDMVIYDKRAFEEKYGFPVEDFVDYKAILGDTSDNIPGVKGIGEKGASDLIKQYKRLENIYAHLEDIKPAIRSKLEQNKDNAFLSRTLSTIERNVEITFILEDAVLYNFTVAEVKKKFIDLEFKSLIAKIPDPGFVGKATNKNEKTDSNLHCETEETCSEIEYTIITTDAALEKLVEKIRKQKLFSIDTESTSLDINEAQIVGISIGFLDKSAYFIPVRIDSKNQILLYSKEIKAGESTLWKSFVHVLEEGVYKKIGHNIKYDMHVLKSCSIKLSGIYFDTLIASYILNLAPNDLKSLGLKYENIEMKTFKELTNNLKIHIHDVDKKELGKYASYDAYVTFRLYERFLNMFEEEQNTKLKEVFFDIEMPLIDILYEMEKKGIILDTKYMQEVSEKIETSLRIQEQQIYEIVGHEFNIASPKQLSVIIFDELKLPRGKKTKTGYSTDEKYFASIGNIHPIVQCVRQYRELAKLKSTYINTLPQLIGKDNRIHTSYNQAVASSGRLSSTNPNLQNIPVKTDLGNSIRKAFIADKNAVFVSFDYSQIELRIAADFSQDKGLIQAFNEGLDVHTQTAKLIFNKETISYDERRIAKTINFGIMYGISSFGLAEQLQISRGDAQKLIQRYFTIYSGIAAYIEKQKKLVLEKHYVESLFGRRRIFTGIESAGNIAKNAMLREAINMPIQGTNADIIKMVMKKCDEMIKEKKYHGTLLLQVHDELIYEYCFDDEIHFSNFSHLVETDNLFKSFCQDIQVLMEHTVNLSVPIKADIAVGKRWGEMEDIHI